MERINRYNEVWDNLYTTHLTNNLNIHKTLVKLKDKKQKMERVNDKNFLKEDIKMALRKILCILNIRNI